MVKQTFIITAVLAILLPVSGLLLAGCALFGKEERGCAGDGSCYYNYATGSYKWCGEYSCGTNAGDVAVCNCK
jgi:hypothetical protein